MARWCGLRAALCARLYSDAARSEAGMAGLANSHNPPAIHRDARNNRIKETARRSAHSIKAAHTGAQQRAPDRSVSGSSGGRAENLLPLTTSQSIVADYRPERRADAALLLARAQFRSATTPKRRDANATSCCSHKLCGPHVTNVHLDSL